MLLLVVTFSCSEDFETTENSNGTHFGIKEKGTKVRIITNDEVNFIKSKLEQEIEKSGKISILENKGSSFRTANTGEIDYSQIMEVIDTLGIKNYTFKILNHPEDNYKTFHNLVLTEKENSLEVTVLKYEMSDFFAQQFDNAPETFINFEGTITSRGLVTSPCDELIIDFPRNGNPGSGGGGGSGGCTQVDISFVCDNCNRSYGNWDTYSGSVCGNGNYGLTIVITYTNLSYMNCRLASDPCDPDGSVGVLLPIDASRAFYRGLTPAQKLWWNNNPDESALITRYLEDNDYSAESETFAQWATTFFINNPDTTWEQFENWFMIELEGKDFFYDEDYWENPNLTFQQQSLPTWSAFSAAYPNETSAQLYGVVGGAVAQAQINFPLETQNGCALKVSRALNYSGVVIPNIPSTTDMPGTVQGGDGKYYFLNARALNIWMQKTFGTNNQTNNTPFNENHYHFTAEDGGTNGENFPSLVNGLKGIFSMVSTNPQWASGHADILYPDGTCKAGCHFQDTPPAPIDYIDIWILD